MEMNWEDWEEVAKDSISEYLDNCGGLTGVYEDMYNLYFGNNFYDADTADAEDGMKEYLVETIDNAEIVRNAIISEFYGGNYPYANLTKEDIPDLQEVINSAPQEEKERIYGILDSLGKGRGRENPTDLLNVITYCLGDIVDDMVDNFINSVWDEEELSNYIDRRRQEEQWYAEDEYGDETEDVEIESEDENYDEGFDDLEESAKRHRKRLRF